MGRIYIKMKEAWQMGQMRDGRLEANYVDYLMLVFQPQLFGEAFLPCAE